jgi:hypothetical protein
VNAKYSFENCSQLTPSQCVTCNNGYVTNNYAWDLPNSGNCNVTQKLLGCYLNTNVQCLDNSTCSTAGSCSDRELLVDLSVTPAVYGACVSPRILPIGDYLGSSELPFCLPQCNFSRHFFSPLPVTTFPNGCINNYTTPEISCTDTWYTPATTKETCESPQGNFSRHFKWLPLKDVTMYTFLHFLINFPQKIRKIALLLTIRDFSSPISLGSKLDGFLG